MSEKRHQPTPRALRMARRRGEVASSADVTSTAVFAAVTAAAAIGAGWWLDGLAAVWQQAMAADVLRHPLDHLRALLQHAGVVLGASIVTITATAMLAAASGGVLQVGGLMAWQRLRPDITHLDPAAGLRRVFSMRNLVNLAKLVVKTALLAALAVVLVRGLLPTAASLGRLPPPALAELAGRAPLSCFAWAGLAFAVVAAIDHWHQRFEFIRQHRMSHDDLRRDHREGEGDPLSRSRRRATHFESVYLSPQDRIRAASAVVYSRRVAIAVQYLGEAEPPRIILRGEGSMAELARRLAAEAQVPTTFDPSLAERLFDDGALDRPVPAHCLQAVSALLRHGAVR